MNKIYVIIFSVFFLSACSNNELCNNEASFDRWNLQQTWYTKSNTREFKKIGAIFGDNGGDFHHPIEKINFSYCVQGMTLYVNYSWLNNILGKSIKVEILEINEETMTLLFPDGATFTYFRNETIE